MVVMLYEVFIAHSWLLLDENSSFYNLTETRGVGISCFEHHCHQVMFAINLQVK